MPAALFIWRTYHRFFPNLRPWNDNEQMNGHGQMNDHEIMQDNFDMAKVLQEQAQQNQKESGKPEGLNTPSSKPKLERKLSTVNRQKNVSF